MPARLITNILIPLALSLAPACAQQPQATLDDNGQWVQTAAPEPDSDAATLAEARVSMADGRPDRAVSILNKWIDANKRTTSPYLPEAYLLRGRAKVAAGNEYKALYDFEQVIREYPAAEQFQDANYEEYKIAIAYLDGLNRKTFGMRISPAESVGEEALVRVAERLPGSTLREQAFLSLADYYYFRAVDLKFASLMYGFLIDQFPNTRHLKEVMARQIYSNVARFKGPKYDASSLIEADILIQRFAAQYPADARRTGIDNALRARIDESLAAQMLQNARWYAGMGDKVAARFTLKRLQRKHPNTVAAADGRELATRIGVSLAPVIEDESAVEDQPVEEASEVDGKSP